MSLQPQAATTTTEADHVEAPQVAIIVGSTRPGRKADTVAEWVRDIAAGRDDATFDVVDIADYALPHLDEPVPPRGGQYSHRHTLAWAERIASYDAYLFVTPEYNGSIPGALKNAIDFLYAEWNDKPAAFVGYGINGATRAIEHLRLVLTDLQVTAVGHPVALTLGDDFQNHTEFTPRESRQHRVTVLLDELVQQAQR